MPIEPGTEPPPKPYDGWPDADEWDRTTPIDRCGFLTMQPVILPAGEPDADPYSGMQLLSLEEAEADGGPGCMQHLGWGLIIDPSDGSMHPLLCSGIRGMAHYTLGEWYVNTPDEDADGLGELLGLTPFELPFTYEALFGSTMAGDQG